MLKESIARRYSAALYALAVESDTVRQVSSDLDAVVVALHSDAELADFFASPVVERETKIAILKRTIDGRVSELSMQFIILLVRKRRETLLGTIARQLHERMDDAAGREVAEIVTPSAMSSQQLADLARRLSHVYGRDIVPNAKVEPDLLGGLVVQVGDRYVDASTAGKLEELRRHLLASTDTWGLASPNGKGT